MKTKQLLLVISFALSGAAFSQDKWDTDGNNLSAGSKFGSVNNHDINIFTNNIKRGEFTKNGKFNFFGTIKTDTLKADSLIVNGGARIKGRLHVGNNSLWIGSTPNFGTDDITSTQGIINFGGEGSNPFNLPFSQIKVGLGTQTPLFNLHIVDSRSPSNQVRMTFGNVATASGSGTTQIASDGFQVGIFGAGAANLNQQEPNLPITLTTAGGFVGVSNTNVGFNPTSLFHVSDGANQTDMQVTNNSTGNAAADGFKFGITNTGIGQIKQQENLPLQFHTNNTQRAVILANGRFGINNTNPLNRFVVTSAAADFGGGNGLTPGGSSGIRTTNMTSATPTLAGNGKVVTVNANGDFYLAPDGGGAAGPAIGSQNGLNNNVNALNPLGLTEMGGPLLHNTDVALQNFDMMWSGLGRFNISSTGLLPINTAIAPKITFYNTELSTGEYFLTDLSVNPPGVTVTEASRIENNTHNGSVNYAGVFIASGDAQVFGISTEGQTSSASSQCYGINAGSTGGFESIGGSFVGKAINGITQKTYGAIGSSINGDFEAAGVFGTCLGSSPIKRGVFGSISLTNAFENSYAIYGEAESGNSSIPSPSNTNVYGVYGATSYGDNNYGVYGAIKNNGNNGYAIFGDVSGATQSTFTNLFAGYFNGNVEIAGTLALPTGVGSIITGSDQNLKTNIDSITNALNIIKSLAPKQFYMDTVNRYFLKGQSKKQYGLIAQQVENILPELISKFNVPDKKDSVGNVLANGGSFKGLNYNAFISILIKGMQEQQRTIDSIRTVLSTTTSARIINPANNPNSTTSVTTLNKQNVTLSNAEALVLDQNQPNPFNESTVIKYNVPEKYGYAQLIFTTIEGRILKTIDINKKGAGEITVYANDLSNGIYTYTLVVDGKTVDSKKMVKQN